jgi:hypothetical protein
MGMALAASAVNELAHPGYFHSSMDVTFPTMFGSMFLLGSYLLLRRRTAP